MPSEKASLFDIASHLKHGPVTVLVDYDGTLVPIAPTPDLATPDGELMGLLNSLAAIPRIELHIVSGRPVATLDAWFGDLPIALWAEHGFWHRPVGKRWEPAATGLTQWLDRIRPIFEHFTIATPGALFEEKGAGFTWHYRGTEPGFGGRQATLLRALLTDALRGTPLETVEGKKAVEVRMRSVNKGLVAQRVLAQHDDPTGVLAIGDDETDEDLFRALPDSAITVAVGPGLTSAKYNIEDHHATRDLLRALMT